MTLELFLLNCLFTNKKSSLIYYLISMCGKLDEGVKQKTKKVYMVTIAMSFCFKYIISFFMNWLTIQL